VWRDSRLSGRESPAGPVPSVPRLSIVHANIVNDLIVLSSACDFIVRDIWQRARSSCSEDPPTAAFDHRPVGTPCALHLLGESCVQRVYQPLPKELDVTYLNSCPGSFMAAGRGGASVLAPEENKDHPSWLMIIDYIREPSAPTSCAILFYSALLSLTPARLF
jgi:hypothetical protein